MKKFLLACVLGFASSSVYAQDWGTCVNGNCSQQVKFQVGYTQAKAGATVTSVTVVESARATPRFPLLWRLLHPFNGRFAWRR